MAALTLVSQEANSSEQMGIQSIYDTDFLALYTCGGGSVTFPLYVPDLLVKDYINADQFRELSEVTNFSESLWFTAERVNGKLQLVK